MTLSSDTTHPEAAKRATRSVAFITPAACLIFWVFVFADSGWGQSLPHSLAICTFHWSLLACCTSCVPQAIFQEHSSVVLCSIAMEHGLSSSSRPSFPFSASC